MKKRPYSRRSRRAAVLALSAFLMVIMLGMVAFSIDLGVLVLAHTQLQVAADSAVSVAVQADGRMIFGGQFYSVGGFTRNRAARINPDGTLDGGFDPNVSTASAFGPLHLERRGTEARGFAVLLCALVRSEQVTYARLKGDICTKLP